MPGKTIGCAYPFVDKAKQGEDIIWRLVCKLVDLSL